MRTTVVIPLYNAGGLIRSTLDSVFRQTTPVEVLVVDDGSTDGSDQIVGEFPRAKLLRNPAKGANAARRFGVEQVITPLVAVLDQDDVWHPDHIAVLESALDLRPTSLAAVGGVVRFSGAPPEFSNSWGSITAYDPWACFPINHVCTPSQVLMRTQSLREEGGWCSHVIGVADFHAWLRLGSRAPLCEHSAITVGYRQHPNSYSTMLRRANRHQFFERFLDAAAEVLPTRLRHHPEERVELERCLACGRAFARWLRCLDERQKPAALARKVDATMQSLPRYQARAMLGQALYFTKGFSNGAGAIAKARTLVWLAVSAPISCHTLRFELLRRLWARRPETHASNSSPDAAESTSNAPALSG